MFIVTNRYSGLQILLRASDAVLLPVSFVVCYRANALPASAHESAASHPGLIVSALMMALAARAIFRVEVAIRTPWLYRWDVAHLARCLGRLLLMALAIRFLR